jgi:hypothetical protein
MNYYYILENEEIVESKWEKEPGERHLNSKVKSVATKEKYNWFKAEENLKIEQHNKEIRKINNQINKIADLRLAGMILKAGNNLNININDTFTVMKDLAPDSFDELKKHIR